MPTEVIDTDAKEAPLVPDGQGKDKGKEETVTISKSELASIRRESQERGEAATYWSGLHRNGNGKQEERAEETNDDDARQFLDETAVDGIEGDTPEKLVDEFAAKGVAALKSRGFITAADAQKLAVETALKVSREMIGRERQKITSDAQLMTEFPELRDNTSELFKETAKIYQMAVTMDPNAKKTPAALYLAAKAAKAGMKPASRDRGDDRDRNGDREDEDDRRRRADSQDGRTRGRGDVDDRDDLLGEEAKQVIKAMGITEAEFKASQKETAGMGRSGRRR